MRRITVFLFVYFISFNFFGQEATLPEDFRQHNLTQFNASLWNATYALDWNTPKAISLWTRWQWQSVDTDPTSIFVNYTHDFTPNTAVGLGFLEHNTGTFLNTGGVLNFAQSISIRENINLILGANVYLFRQEIADDRFNADLGIETESDFLAQFSPAIRLNISSFNLALSLENAIDYNFSLSESNSDTNSFIGVLSNDFPVTLFPSIANNFVRPIVYVKTIPDTDTQYGGNILFSTDKFWTQAGYNSFYGPSGGVGVTFFKKLSVGGLVEFGVSDLLSDEDTTFEFIASYNFGKRKAENEVLDVDIEEVEEIEEEAIPEIDNEDELEKEDEQLEPIETAEEETSQKKEEEKTTKKALREEKKKAKEDEKLKKKELKKEKARAALEAIRLKEKQEQEELDRIRQEEEAAQIKQAEEAAKIKREKALLEEQAKAKADSIRIQAQKEIELLKEQRRIDSIAQISQTKKVEVLPGEKYEEVSNTTIDGLAPGFYLIANVFGTQRYFNAFMKDLADKGLAPKSFYRTENKYNYVYLRRYNTIEEAREARNSGLNGRYSGKTWIFRVKGN